MFQFSSIFRFLSNPRTNVSAPDKKRKTVWNSVGGLTKMSEAHFVWSAATTLQTDSGSSKQFLNVGVLEKHVQLVWDLWEPWGNSSTLNFFLWSIKAVEIRLWLCLRFCAFLSCLFFETRKGGNFVWNLTPGQSKSESTWACGALPQDVDSIILDSFHPVAIYKKDRTNQRRKQDRKV